MLAQPMKEAPIANREVVGFHGTSADQAARILEESRWAPSKNPYDWLGHGIYFWEESYPRARQWAEQKHSGDAAVLKTTMKLGRCLDLLMDTNWVTVLQNAYARIEERCEDRGEPMPENRDGRRELDCAVINEIADNMYDIDTARAAYHEGSRVYPDAAFRDLTHVQVVVRNEDVILEPPRRADAA